MKKKIYVVDGGMGMPSGNWIVGDYVRDMEDANLVMFTGGADINPSLYGEKRHPFTHCNDHRDEYEVDKFNRAKSLGLPMIGICRGAQLLCAMAGGKLVQHQENRGSHIVRSGDIEFGPQTYAVTSCHHQAQYPWLLPYGDWTLLGYSIGESDYHQGGNKEEMVLGMANLSQWGGGRSGNDLIEIEDAYYSKLRALAIQSHPEWLNHNTDTIAHYRKLVDKLMAGDF